MTAATNARLNASAGLVAARCTLPIKADEVLYKRTMVSKDADGRAVEPTDGDGLPVMGVASATFDATDLANDALDAEVEFGVHGVAYTGTVPKTGDLVYAVDNQTVSIDSDSGARGLAGVCTETRDGLCYVQFGPGADGLLAAVQSLDERIEDLEDNAVTAQARISISLASLRETTNFNVGNAAANGGLLASDTTPVLSAINGATDGCQRLRWAASNGDQVTFQISLPADLDDTADLKLYTRIASGGTTDPVGFSVRSFFDEADTAIDDTSATNQTTTYANALTTIAAADVPAGAKTLTVGLTPVAHTTDTLDMTAVWLEYTRKVLAS